MFGFGGKHNEERDSMLLEAGKNLILLIFSMLGVAIFSRK